MGIARIAIAGLVAGFLCLSGCVRDTPEDIWNMARPVLLEPKLDGTPQGAELTIRADEGCEIEIEKLALNLYDPLESLPHKLTIQAGEIRKLRFTYPTDALKEPPRWNIKWRYSQSKASSESGLSSNRSGVSEAYDLPEPSVSVVQTSRNSTVDVRLTTNEDIPRSIEIADIRITVNGKAVKPMTKAAVLSSSEPEVQVLSIPIKKGSKVPLQLRYKTRLVPNRRWQEQAMDLDVGQ